ncbi:hypothetical protein LB003_06240 [Loigolactobacillus bifermentans]|nr:hypothetical protein LB003_06240 [Loigolactobacillus bifermentans]
MIVIKDLLGNEAPLIKNGSQQLNVDLMQPTQLQFTAYEWPENLTGFSMISELCLFQLDGEWYRETDHSYVKIGNIQTCQITALSVLHDLAFKRIKNDFSNNTKDDTNQTVTLKLDDMMKKLVENTKFTYTIHDDYGNHSHYFSDAVTGTALDILSNTIPGAFDVEYAFSNYHIDIYHKIGKTKSFVFLEGANVGPITRHYDDTTITTTIHADGKTDDKTQKPTIDVDYESPAVKQYGYPEIAAEEYSNENCTDKNQLLTEAKTKLQDYPLLQLSMDYHQFRKGSIGSRFNESVSVGNSGFIRSRSGLDVESRITAMVLFPGTSKTPQVTIGNVIGNFAATIARLKSNKASDNVLKIINKQATQLQQQINLLQSMNANMWEVGEIDDEGSPVSGQVE